MKMINIDSILADRSDMASAYDRWISDEHEV